MVSKNASGIGKSTSAAAYSRNALLLTIDNEQRTLPIFLRKYIKIPNHRIPGEIYKEIVSKLNQLMQLLYKAFKLETAEAVFHFQKPFAKRNDFFLNIII